MNTLLNVCKKISCDNIKIQRFIFLTINSVIWIIPVVAVWAVFKLTVGASVINLICAAGYAAIFPGILGGILKLMNCDLW